MTTHLCLGVHSIPTRMELLSLLFLPVHTRVCVWLFPQGTSMFNELHVAACPPAWLCDIHC